MLEYCSGSCNPSCNGNVKVEDDSIKCSNYVENCKFWASKGECKRNPSYMLWQCPQLCHPKCLNKTEDGKRSTNGNGTADSSNSNSAPAVKFSIKILGGSKNKSNAAIERRTESKKVNLPFRSIRPEKGYKRLNTKFNYSTHAITRIPKTYKSVKNATSRPRGKNSSKRLLTLKSTTTTTTMTPTTTTEEVESISAAMTSERTSMTNIGVSKSSSTTFLPLSPLHIPWTDQNLEVNRKKVKILQEVKTVHGGTKNKTYKLRHRFVQQRNIAQNQVETGQTSTETVTITVEQ